MSWESYSPVRNGICRVSDKSNTHINGTYHLVTVYTGRSKTFWGYRLTVQIDGHSFVGEDRRNMIDAVRQCGHAMEAAGYELKVVAMAENFYESGLSANSGYGYQDRHSGAKHMMDDVLVPNSSGQ